MNFQEKLELIPWILTINPNFNLIIDDIIEQGPKQKLNEFINKWLINKINNVLKSLVDLKNINENNSSIKALAYQLYEILFCFVI